MSGETVHYWILDDAIKARNSVEDRIKNELKTSVKKLRYRALEWDLDIEDRKSVV